MKNNSLGTKVLMLMVTLGVLAYFAMQGFQYFSDPLSTTLAYNYRVEESEDLSGYVVRSERVLSDDSNGLLRIQRAEGERVSAGGTVATVYADQASLDRQNEMDALKARIEQIRYAQSAALGSEASLKLDAQIMRDLLDYRADLTAGRLDNAEDHGAELRALVLKRDYTSNDSEDLTAQLTDLQTRLKGLQSQAAGSVRRLTAPVSGLYSAVVDGYETALTPDMLSGMTPTQFSALQAGEAGDSVGKLVLGRSWYYAVTMNAGEARELKTRRGLKLRFSKGVERDLDVVVDAIGPEENGRVVVVLRGDTYLPELTLLRRQSAQVIWSASEGIRIPKEALRAQKTTLSEDGGRTVTEGLGVYCVVGVEARFKPVEVLYQGDGFVLVRSTAHADQEAVRLRPGDEVIISAKDLFDGKVVAQQ